MKIALVSMPMMNARHPSLALTKLKYALDQTFKGEVRCNIRYLTHDFAHHVGLDLYNRMMDELPSGLGEWFFRPIAFPEAPDNTEKYFECFFPQKDEQTERFRAILREKRRNLEHIFDRMIQDNHLPDYDMVGFTSSFFQNVASLAMAGALKRKNRDIVTIMGGANVEFPMGIQIIKHCRQIDHVFSGPALKSLPAFVQHRLDGDFEKCREIKGVWSKKNIKDHSETIPDDFSHGERTDIDRPLTLDYDSFLQSYERHFPNAGFQPYLFFATSEGCYWGEKSPCTFCAQAGPVGNTMKFSCMPSGQAVETIESLGRYAGRVELLYATDSILPRHYPREVFSKIRSKIPIHLEMNVHHMDEEKIKMLADAGVRITETGVESLSTESLRLMRKGSTASQNLAFMMNCMMNGIHVTWNFLLGFPGENERIYEKLYHDIPILAHFPPGEITAVGFERYSEYHKHPERFGLVLEPMWFYLFTYPFPREALSNLCYNFYDRGNGGYRKALEKWVNKLIERGEHWKSLWRGKEGNFPYLYFDRNGDRQVVVDSRTGTLRKHFIGDAGFHLLRMLRKPTGLERLAEANPGIDVEKEIDLLDAKGLIFRDGERYFNIVFPGRPGGRVIGEGLVIGDR